MTFPIFEQVRLQVVPKCRVIPFRKLLLCQPEAITGLRICNSPLLARLLLQNREYCVLGRGIGSNVEILISSLRGVLQNRSDSKPNCINIRTIEGLVAGVEDGSSLFGERKPECANFETLFRLENDHHTTMEGRTQSKNMLVERPVHENPACSEADFFRNSAVVVLPLNIFPIPPSKFSVLIPYSLGMNLFTPAFTAASMIFCCSLIPAVAMTDTTASCPLNASARDSDES